jgi:hypothetical protein
MDSGEDSVDGRARQYQRLPGLLQTCRQLRTTFPLYFELNEIYVGYPWDSGITVHEWEMTWEAILAFLQAMPETQRNMFRRVCLTVPRAIDLLLAIASHRKEVADDKPNDDLPPANTLPLASMTGLKQLTIYVDEYDSTADCTCFEGSTRCPSRGCCQGGRVIVAKVPCSRVLHVKGCSRFVARKL